MIKCYRSSAWVAAFACATLLLSDAAIAQFRQEGSKLLGTGSASSFGPFQGHAVAVSADGKTAVVGDPGDDGGTGAAWIWIRNRGAWTQQGPKLVAKNAVGPAGQGYSVALSADGDTVIIGGNRDDGFIGAAWIWTRSGNVWTPRGSKLVGTGAIGRARQGASVSLSADGDTAIVGGNFDNGGVGAAWIWTRSGGTLIQQGPKLVGADAVGSASQGTAVSLAADGRTAIVGANHDNGLAGAAWVWTRSGGVWAQDGPKLVASDAAGNAGIGNAVSLSAGGTTAIVGGRGDGELSGAAWVWIREAGGWRQQGSKLVAKGADNGARQGAAVALSADGNTALIGGDFDNRMVGGAWIWSRVHGTWTQQGPKLVSTWSSLGGSAASLSADGLIAVIGGSGDGTGAGAAWVFRLSSPDALLADVDGDRKADFVIWEASTGTWSWLTSRSGRDDGARAEGHSPSAGGRDVALAGDLDGDGKADLVVWRRNTGTFTWQTSSTAYSAAAAQQATPAGPGELGDVPMLADLDGDGKADLVVWRASTGTWTWLTSSTAYAPARAGSKRWGDQSLGDVPMVADVDGDGKADLIVWRAATGTFHWLTSSSGYSEAAEGKQPFGAVQLGDVPMAADLDGDGKADLIVWRASTGIWYWLPSKSAYALAATRKAALGDAALGDVPALADLDGDGKMDLIVWRATTETWLGLTSSTEYDPSAQVRQQWKTGTTPR